MQWSKKDVERFSAPYEGKHDFKIISVKGVILRYSMTSNTRVWVFEAKLRHGGPNLQWTVHYVPSEKDKIEAGYTGDDDLLM